MILLRDFEVATHVLSFQKSIHHVKGKDSFGRNDIFYSNFVKVIFALTERVRGICNLTGNPPLLTMLCTSYVNRHYLSELI